MKIPLAYPKIPDTKDFPPKKCYVFEKYDGTNLHFVRQGPFPWGTWKSFGTRRDRFQLTKSGWKEFSEAHPGMDDLIKVWNRFQSEAVYIIDGLAKFLNAKQIILFTEYFGPRSFAGQHYKNDSHKLVIIDVQVDDKIVPPDVFALHFCENTIHPWMPKLLYRGKYSGQLVQDIRAGKYTDGEGAVLKGTHNNQIYMAKVKTDKYMRSLQMKFKENWKEYWE